MGEFTVLGEQLLFMGVCSSLPLEEVKRKAGAILCGTTGGWQFSEKSFSKKTPNPNPCPDSPETHKHYLFEC